MRGRVLQYLKQVADQLKLPHKQDAAGNIVIYRPGSGGGEGALPVIIQGHVDMVTEKNSDIVHDFHQDALKLQLAGDWLKVGCHSTACLHAGDCQTPRGTCMREHLQTQLHHDCIPVCSQQLELQTITMHRPVGPHWEPTMALALLLPWRC